MDKEIELIKSPWLNTFRKLLTQTNTEFTFTSPFIKLSVVNLIFECRKSNFSINGLTSFRLRNFERGVSDLGAIKLLFDKQARIKNIANIHSKIYIFDSTAAVISSANLTPGGLIRNVELGVLLRERNVVKELKNYVGNLLKDNQKSFDITEEIISESERVLESIPKEVQRTSTDLQAIEKELFKIDDGEEDKVFQAGATPILTGLTGWKKDVFSCLVDLKKDVFKLDEIYHYTKHLARLHPENKYVQPKIRQQLQILRDMGLIEFTMEKGVYRKLWK
jgi:phosphatidylserine/phosphatidylglycerophosphate/cardiolipin synthase-like enzyme